MVTATQEASALAAAPRRLLIGGTWHEASGARTLTVEDPSVGQALADVADAGPAEAIRALDAACAAAPGWARRSPRERADVLYRAHAALLAAREELALLVTLENGKPLDQARDEIVYAADYLRWYAEEAVRIEGGFQTAPDGRGRALIMRQPVGPALAVLPWNWPVVMAARDLAPALAAGCPIVLKPAPETPLSCLALARIVQEAGAPDGVVNVVTTSRPSTVVSALLDDERLRVLSFTGSSEVGLRLAARAAHRHPLRLSMELGGNAPFIVFSDADLDDALEGAMRAKIRNVGESCTAANRFLVAERIAERFAGELARRMGELVVGRGTEPEVAVGPLISRRRRDCVADLVDEAVARGATVLTGGRRPRRRGYFYPPTVLTHVPSDARVLQEEIFGPVAPILSFRTEDEAVEIANATPFGLVAYIYTHDFDRAMRVTERLETGMVGLNQGVVSNPSAPFGGVKFSGFGRKGGQQGLEEYLDTKYVALTVAARRRRLAEARCGPRQPVAGGAGPPGRRPGGGAPAQP